MTAYETNRRLLLNLRHQKIFSTKKDTKTESMNKLLGVAFDSDEYSRFEKRVRACQKAVSKYGCLTIEGAFDILGIKYIGGEDAITYGWTDPDFIKIKQTVRKDRKHGRNVYMFDISEPTYLDDEYWFI